MIISKRSLEKYFLLVDETRTNSLIRQLDIKFKIDIVVKITFSRICYSLSQLTDNNPYQNRLVEASSKYLKLKAIAGLQADSTNLKFAESLATMAAEILPYNRESALNILSLFRELAQKGIYDPPQLEFGRMFDIYLASYPQLIKMIGQSAVKNKNSDFLFRCLEEVGFLGCTAIKANHYDVAIECLQTLVQLGREAKGNNIKCFWRHCMLETIDHAEERIWWMLSWVPHLERKERDRWAESFSTAYSRLTGFKVEIQEVLIEERIGFQFNRTDEKYVERFSKDQFVREIDYSDYSDLKEFKLY
ncbi:MAG: hypothetical protein H3C64_05045 [Candidatus Kuenenia stuttgartiensis]|nr:hypothetical protein [Candidatus Kuenenia stuttgartiensis]